MGEGHFFTTVIAYQLVQVIRARVHQAGERVSWTTLRGILEGHQSHSSEAISPKRQPVGINRRTMTMTTTFGHQLIAGQHRIKPGHFLRRQEPLYRLHPVAPRVPAGAGVVAAVSPKLSHAHH